MAIKIGMKAVHPGGFIKRAVLPDDLSVTAAAEALGVGRPALSNLLNGKASLSPEMALRIAQADRLLWSIVARLWSDWRRALFFVQPRTVTVSRLLAETEPK